MNAVDQETHSRDYLIPSLDGINQEQIKAIKAIALSDEDLTKSILSPDGQMALANIRYKDNTNTQESRLAIADSILVLRDSLRNN